MTDKFPKSICWLRRDLRLTDHRALFEATRQSQSVTIVFVFDTKILRRLKNPQDRRVTMILESLREIDSNLRRRKSHLVVLHGDPSEEIPKIAHSLKADAVFTNEDYEPYAKKRDSLVEARLGTIRFFTFKDQVIFSGSEVLKNDGTPYRVFTPYKKAWLAKINDKDLLEYTPDLGRLARTTDAGVKLDYTSIGFSKVELELVAGEAGAKATLKKFSANLKDYAQLRNFPAAHHGTSHLSPHLRFGTLSVRAMARTACSGNSTGHQSWLNELIWRDFYHMILDRYPSVEKHAFNEKYDKIRWPGLTKHYRAWCEGRTGFPLVDAAMRQLNATGWMHNRLRMVVASFLVKDLLVNWQLGERYFARSLLDFDLAANNGGWQWCASTGCDAQPYFRIFNPLNQSLKFDPKGEFIRRWVPELRSLSNHDIHCPENVRDYPKPIVDHSVQRLRAIRLFKKI